CVRDHVGSGLDSW
nr:immunoglobulin heavy chain junction region [Macaca mulatta]MOW45646.1 immunoglobulin heavy chain junction region [Macaca mulatta]MOW45808.1 immunoglobulin heavy chain junction region [Macaca mulatta]MOW45823.1 immunoglobulin heavy chain junction region [Macaca mulatta]MOW45873.1 immunoglobulin heavy chain junction region [Macaca mulatta]